MVLEPLKQWVPFNLDAAGFLTLLGGNEVNQSVGRFVRSTWLEYMPLLAPYVLASGQFESRQAGFDLYNLSNGIHTTNFAGWLTRLVASHQQTFPANQTIMQVRLLGKPHNPISQQVKGVTISAIAFGILFTICILACDWSGFASTTGVLVSVIVRVTQIEKCRKALDNRFAKPRYQDEHNNQRLTKTMIEYESNVVTAFIPSDIFFDVIHNNPTGQTGSMSRSIRYTGWVAFIVHIVTLNSATFLVKLLTSVWLIVNTVLFTWKVGCEDSAVLRTWRKLFTGIEVRSPVVIHIGRRLELTLYEWPLECEFQRGTNWTRLNKGDTLPGSRSEKRQDLYARLCCSMDEENSMAKWDLFPHARDHTSQWWHDYNMKKALIADDPPNLIPQTLIYRYRASTTECINSDAEKG